MTDPGPVRVVIEVSPGAAVVTFDRWASPELAALVKDAPGSRWHRRNGPVPRCWTLPPAAARDLAEALSAAGAEVTRRVVQPGPVALLHPGPRNYPNVGQFEDWAAVRATAAALLAIPSWAEVAARCWEDLPAEPLEPPELLEPPASPDVPAEPLCLPEPLCPPASLAAPAERLGAAEPLGTPARTALPAGPLTARDPLTAPDWHAVDAVPLRAVEPLQGGCDG